MNRRNIMASMAALLANCAYAEASSIRAGKMSFDWRHQNGRLWAELTAPAPGWLAVGFNDVPRLVGTRFIIAAIGAGGVRAEEHIAGNGNHQEVGALGGVRMLTDVKGARQGAQSWLQFSLPEAGNGPYAKPLAAGTLSFLMLAWSHAPEFEHHSAWRQHFEVKF